MKKYHKNFDLFQSFSHFVPGPSELGKLVIWFIVGVLLGNAVSLVSLALPGEYGLEITYAVAYPVMFLPPMIYASLASKKNSFFESGTAMDSSHFGKLGGIVCALMLVIGTFALGFVMDYIASVLPEPPQWFTDLMKNMTGGNFVLNFITVSLFAPFFEEWLCRGMVLRGLLNFKRKDGSRGMKPVWAVVISAAFFAIIHGNIWQGLIAFAAGCFFGFIYYRTGSLKLTMLMHFTNNTISLILSNLKDFENAESWMDIIPQGKPYWIIFTACVLFLLLTINAFRKIELNGVQGNCDTVTVE